MKKPVKVKKVVADAAFTEGVQEESFKEWFFSKLDGMFIDNIPLDAIKELPTRYMYFAGTISHIASLACFIFFIYTGYNTTRNTEFISLTDTDGECSAVTRQNTGQYLATDTGYWEGSEFFSTVIAIYKVDFFGLNIDTANYEHMIRGFRSSIEELGAKSLMQDASRNVLNWVTFEYSKPQYLFQMTGNSIDVFNRYYVVGGLATLEGNCEVEHSSSLDGANNLLKMQFHISDFHDDELCMKAVTPTLIGYNPNYDYEFFNINIDLNSLLIAIAVGQHVLRISSLSKVPGTETIALTGNGPVVMHKYFDDRWESMNLIYCFEVAGEEACVIKLNDVYALPVLNHYGNDGSGIGRPVKCDCMNSEDASADSYCQIFDFVIGVIFYDRSDAYPLFELISTYGTDMINKLSYDISCDGAQRTLFSPEERKEAYNFCNLSFGPCNVIMFNTFDDKTHGVSDFHYQVFTPACHDTFSISQEAWELLVAEPPLPLVERYYSCKPFIFDALFNSLGIAAGNTAIMVPLLCIGFLPVLFLYLQAVGRVPPKAEYTKAELEAASKALSLIILRIRDKKLRGIKKDSVLHNLTKDLVSAAKAEGGYPDSDDDSDSDEEEVETPKKKDTVKRRSSVLQKSAVFIKQLEEKEPEAKVGFWGSFFNGGNENKKTTTSSNPIVEMSGWRVNEGGIDVLNEDLGDADKRRRNLKNISPDLYLREVRDIMSAMVRAAEFQGTDRAAASFKIAQMKAESLLLMEVEVNDADIDWGALLSEIHTLLILHASLKYGCTIEDATNYHSDTCAYNIGGRIYTAVDIEKKKANYFSM